MKWIELGFRQRPLSQSELDRDVVESAGRETAILVPQPGDDNPNHWNTNIRPRLIKDEKIESMALGERHAGMYLFAPTQAREIPGPGEPGYSSTMPAQKRMIAQRQRIEADTLPLVARGRSHCVDRQGSIQLGERPQFRKSRVEMRSRGERDALLRLIVPVAYGKRHRNLEVSRDV
jgi:hypothetical protein